MYYTYIKKEKRKKKTYNDEKCSILQETMMRFHRTIYTVKGRELLKLLY